MGLQAHALDDEKCDSSRGVIGDCRVRGGLNGGEDRQVDAPHWLVSFSTRCIESGGGRMMTQAMLLRRVEGDQADISASIQEILAWVKGAPIIGQREGRV
eukprot:1147913-Pelagomonas_calceolata.AAC.7